MKRMALPVLIGFLLCCVGQASAAYMEPKALPVQAILLPSEMPIQTSQAGVRADTTWYGDYQIIGGVYYARSFTGSKVDALTNVAWTFDRGNGPTNPSAPLIPDGEGWSVRDLTANETNYWRVIDNTLDLGQGVAPPIISGAKSLWIGADKAQADALCWECGAGYGNTWCQRITSEVLTYNGSGSVTLELKYFQDSEECWDGTQIYLKRADSTELLLNPHPPGPCGTNPGDYGGGFTGRIGTDSLGNLFPETFQRVITQEELGGAQNFHLIVEFFGDDNTNDQDCLWPTVHGPFGADDFTVVGGGINKSYTFEDGFQGWTPGFCDPVGDYAGVANMNGCYTILDPCACKLQNNVLEVHADVCDAGLHPDGQHIYLMSPIIDTGNENLKTIFMDFDWYADLPLECAVLYRPGWMYYPQTCEITGTPRWSDRIGQTYYNYTITPGCVTLRRGGTDLGQAGTPIPNSAQAVIVVIELLSSCESFPSSPCTCPTGNFTPLFDNFVVGVTGAVNAPLVNFEPDTQFQDTGSYDGTLTTKFNPRLPGPANCTIDKNMDNQSKPDLCGDSLVVAGPLPSQTDPNTRWEAKMWWRVAKRGPFQSDKVNGINSRYKVWKDRVSDGLQIDRPYKPQFAWGWMDSTQVGPVPQRNKFLSNFRENDDDFVGEANPENEMIWDDVLFPGTRIQYFVTSNYVNTPNSLYYYPDTLGGNYFEFEVLPGIRVANVANCGGTGFNFCAYQPATLFIDAFGRGRPPTKFFIESALRSVLNGLPPCTGETDCIIPVDRNWDRYDYQDASSNTNAPFARGLVAGSNNGMTLNEILGYRTMLCNTGTFGHGAMQGEDFQLFDQWLISPDCQANANRQLFVMNGDKPGEVLEQAPTAPSYALAFLNNTLGATLYCDAFNGLTQDPDCAPEDQNYCLKLLPVGGGPFGTLVDVDSYGNYCPNRYGFNVYSTNNDGVGNRIYQAEEGGKAMQYAQVVRSNLGASSNYKTVLDGVSWNHMSKRVPGGSGDSFCPRGIGDIVEGSLAEIKAALQWGFDVADPNLIPKLSLVKDLASCQGTWDTNPTSDVDDSGVLRVNRLFQNEPNPFNPRTTIRFSLAEKGRVEIEIFDVNGRHVRTLVSGPMDAGPHSAVWDGTNDAGHKVGSGVYWSQMKAGSYTSNKKMVILK